VRYDQRYLSIPHAVRGAAERYGDEPAIIDGDYRCTFDELAHQMVEAVRATIALDVRPGDRVGLCAPNSAEWIIAALGILGAGGVLVPLNTRFKNGELSYILRKSGARALLASSFLDNDYAADLKAADPELPALNRTVSILGPRGAADLDWQEFLHGGEAVSRSQAQDSIDRLAPEDVSDVMFTSGTTGHPKGVVYTHRAMFLHCLAEATTDLFGISENDRILHIVPMFHANSWCLPYTAVMVGADQIFAGANIQPPDICRLIQSEKVTFTGAVPTVWIAIKELCEKEGYDISSLRTIAIGGSAAPRSLQQAYAKNFGVQMSHAWGMTEMTPLGTVTRLKSYMEDWSDERKYDVYSRVGYASVGVDVRIVDDAGAELPWDGESMGELQVRGPWVIASYYDNPESADRFTADGWFRTGDVATIDAEGYVQITDRTKDLIKSGGEWVSSVDVENLIMSHPKVLEAAVIAVPHPKWVERPLACVVPKPGSALEPGEILEFLRPQLARWALPDAVEIIDAVPKTSVGKFDKKVLRERYKNWTP